MRRVQRSFGCCFDNAPRAARLARLLRQPRRFRRRLPPQAQRAWSEPLPRVPRPRQVDRPRSSGGRAASRRWPAWPLRRPRSVLHARGREHGVAKGRRGAFPTCFRTTLATAAGRGHIAAPILLARCGRAHRHAPPAARCRRARVHASLACGPCRAVLWGCAASRPPLAPHRGPARRHTPEAAARSGVAAAEAVGEARAPWTLARWMRRGCRAARAP